MYVRKECVDLNRIIWMILNKKILDIIKYFLSLLFTLEFLLIKYVINFDCFYCEIYKLY